MWSANLLCHSEPAEFDVMIRVTSYMLRLELLEACVTQMFVGVNSTCVNKCGPSGVDIV